MTPTILVDKQMFYDVRSVAERAALAWNRRKWTRMPIPPGQEAKRSRWLSPMCGKDALTMLNLNSVMIGSQQATELVAFYEKVLGKPADMTDEENGFHGWQVGSGYFSVLKHSEMGGKTKDPGRVMLNFETTQVKEEFERIKALGAIVVREPYAIGEGLLATLADPDGNYFQLITPM